jgi:adenosylcobinamide-GDP ribazoletransferase
LHELFGRLRQLPSDTLTSLSFFSRLPVRGAGASFNLRRSAGAWPIAGLVIAIVPSALYWLFLAIGIYAFLGPLLVIAVMIAITGALHEDGLADTADGFGGGRSRERKLAIMRDSRLGTYGALALLFSVLIRAAALGSIVYPGYPAGSLALLLVAVLSRSMALWHWNSTMPARPDGFAWAAGRPDWVSLLVGLISGGIAAIVLLVAFGVAGLIGILLALVALGFFTSLCRRQIGGHTGDTIGAAQQITETLLLVGLSLSWAAYVD